MFDEIYLQKCEEYEGGKTTGANFSGILYKGLTSVFHDSWSQK